MPREIVSVDGHNFNAGQHVFSRGKAACIHLALSAIVAAAVVFVMLFVWYPTPYFTAMGGVGLVTLIVGVDVVLGPLITLVIFDTKKKSLKFDLACVVFVQVAALAYGVFTMFQARPVYAVFNKDRFDVVIAADMNAAERAKVMNPAFRSLPLSGPQTVAMDVPTDPKELERMMFSGIDTRAFSQHYVSYELKAKEAAAASQTLVQKQKLSPESAEKTRAFLLKSGLDESKVGVLPMYTRNKDMTVVVERATGKILAIAPVSP
jgi:hypothetical protein